jgi:twitching motility protein PilT
MKEYPTFTSESTKFPRFRTRGEIADIGYPQTDLDTFFGWLRECMSDEEIEIFQKNPRF